MTIAARPWYDPNYFGTAKRIIDAGVISYAAGYELLSIKTEMGSADANDVFTPDGSSHSYPPAPAPANPSTYTYGTPRPLSVPNPMVAAYSLVVASITPPNPPHAAGNRWATQTTVVYRLAKSGPMPAGPSKTIYKVGYP